MAANAAAAIAPEHDQWMQRALDLAEAAVQNGEVPVGCVFVSSDGVEVASHDRAEDGVSGS